MSINTAEILATSLARLLQKNPDWQPDHTTSPALRSAYQQLISGAKLSSAIQAINTENKRQNIFDNTLHSSPIAGQR